MNHGALSTRIDGDWQDNPMCRAQPGGWLQYATDFFTDDKAQRLHRQKLRYTIARWGYSRAIAFWGVITESEWVEPYDRGLYVQQAPTGEFAPTPYRTPEYQDQMRQWLRDTARYLKQTDSHPHLVSTHFSNPQNGAEMWQYPELDIIHNNAYTFFSNPDLHWQTGQFRTGKGVADVMHVFVRSLSSGTKPILIGEWGGHPVENNEVNLRQELHTGIWSSFMSNASGATGWWWWNLLDTADLYPQYRALAAYAKGEDRRGKRWRTLRSPLLTQPPAAKADEAADLAIAQENRGSLVLFENRRLYAYIYSAEIDRYTGNHLATGPDDTTFPLSPTFYLRLPSSLVDGPYEAEFWNTYTGEVISRTPVTVTAETHYLSIPPHRVDLAIKLKLVEGGGR